MEIIRKSANHVQNSICHDFHFEEFFIRQNLINNFCSSFEKEFDVKFFTEISLMKLNGQFFEYYTEIIQIN